MDVSVLSEGEDEETDLEKRSKVVRRGNGESDAWKETYWEKRTKAHRTVEPVLRYSDSVVVSLNLVVLPVRPQPSRESDEAPDDQAGGRERDKDDQLRRREYISKRHATNPK